MGEGTTLMKFLEKGPQPATRLRVLTVEDLNQPVIETLGSMLQLSPEFFEEHLLNSGWHDSTVRDVEAKHWPTSKMKKSYASLKWSRPVKMVKSPFNTKVAYNNLLERDPQSFQWRQQIDFKQGNGQVVQNHAALLCNILRPSSSYITVDDELFLKRWLSWTDLDKDTNHSVEPAAWEERITVCRTEQRSCPIRKSSVTWIGH